MFPMAITGRGGTELQEYWHGGAHAHLPFDRGRRPRLGDHGDRRLRRARNLEHHDAPRLRLRHPRRRRHGSSLFLPHAETAEEGIFIASKPGAGRQLLQFLAVSPAQDDVIGSQSSP